MDGWRISVTSAGRILIWAIVVAVVRHAFAKGAPIHHDLRARIAAWPTPVRQAMAALVATRLPILFVGYMAVFQIGYASNAPPFRASENEFLNLQARWDTGWYLGIASDGYRFRRSLPPEAQQNIVFFPALPAIMGATGRLLGGSATGLLIAGTLVALTAFAAALIYLYRFGRDVLEDGEQASYAIWLLSAYPFALFYSAVYTESLFLAGAIGSFYHLRRREYGRAGAWGLLVGLTRPNGCFLSLPLALLALRPWLPPWLAGPPDEPRTHPPSQRHGVVRALLAAAMPVVGVLLYSAYIWQLTGDPLKWAAGHIAWGRSYQGLTTLVTDRYDYLAVRGLYAYTSELSGDLLQAVGPVFVLATVWGVAKQLGPAYAAFILVNMLPPMAAGGLLSAGRFSSVLFPAFVWLAKVTPARHRAAWLAGFMALQAFNAALFYTWRPMY
jgi:hypothetical protein